MPSSNPTGHETYIYDHKVYSSQDRREFLGPLHDNTKLPAPEHFDDDAPLIMVEPSYAYKSTDVFLHFRQGVSLSLPRLIAEQLRDALIKVCQK